MTRIERCPACGAEALMYIENRDDGSERRILLGHVYGEENPDSPGLSESCPYFSEPCPQDVRILVRKVLPAENERR